MKHSKTEIIKALNVIKDICSDESMDCCICPFRKSKNNCMFTEDGFIPDSWNIVELPNEEWRAFK